ncbi:MAG: hypothetical protein Q7K40_05130 [bacterium]|nr:hypothetical protein [bacterium]
MKRGFGLIEIVIGSAVLSAALLSVSSYYQQAIRVSRSTATTVQASLLLEEGVEIARIFRDSGWTNVGSPANGTIYFLNFNGTKWATSTTNTYIDGTFERTVRFDDVYRNGSDDIVATPGTLDPNTRKATVSVSFWNLTATTTRTIETYLTNIF